jgi:hypothetical protein
MGYVSRATRRASLVGEVGKPFIQVVMVMLAGFVMVSAAVVTLAKQFRHAPPSNLFAAYTDIYPGRSVDIRELEARGFYCVTGVLSSPADLSEMCELGLPDGSISVINLLLWDKVVVKLSFSFQERVLTIGDLALLSGDPDIRVSGHSVNLNWRDQHITRLVLAQNKPVSYFEPVRLITFGR